MATDEAVRVEGIAVRYANGALGVLDISFAASRGQIVALFGPNGAGKTTSVRAVSGFMRTERHSVIRGSVRLFGTDVTGYEPHRTARMGVGFVPERSKVFATMSVRDNLRAVGQMPHRKVYAKRLAEIHALFPVMEERMHQLAGQLSGGQQQMLSIARSLIMAPSVLIVDELTLGLHHSFHGPLFEALQGIARRGTTVIVVDESTGFALKVADYCYLLNSGRVASEGPPSRYAGNELLVAGYVGSDP
jgi:branched-chain amino acid transport system ATP-binding protein